MFETASQDKGAATLPGKRSSVVASVRRYALLLVIAWSAAIAVSLVWNLLELRRNVNLQAQTEARTAFQKDLLYRRWAAGHGGVYVPVTDETPPNRYLSHIEERDLETPSGRQLTLVNPAYMTRQVFELGKEQYGVRGHITSLNPIRPGNAPDPWERGALEAFEQGETEVSSVEEIDGAPFMRLMRPMVTESRCLKCHAAQGYKEGEIRGGISVSVPLAEYRADFLAYVLPLSGSHVLLWLLGVAGLTLGGRSILRYDRARTQAEIKLQESEQQLREVYAAADNVALVTTDLGGVDTRILDFSPGAEKLFGYTKEEVIGKRVAMLHPADVVKDFPAMQDPLHSGEKGYSGEAVLIRKGGQEFPALFTIHPRFNGDGRLVGTVGVSIDITKRVTLENTVRRLVEASSRQLGESFFESMALELARTLEADYTLIGELHGKEKDSIRTLAAVAGGKLAANFEYELAGTPCENVVGKSVCSYPMDVDELFPRDHLLKEMAVKGYVGVPVFDSAGAALGIMVALYRSSVSNIDFAESILQVFSARVGSEIERMRSEEALREREADLRKAQAIAHIGNWTWEIASNTVRWSDELYRILGLEPQSIEATPQAYWNAIHPDDLETERAASQIALSAAGNSYQVEHRIVRPDGSQRIVHSRGEITQWSDDGDPILMVGTTQDITERKQAEQALVRHQRAITLSNRIANVFLTSPPDVLYTDVLDTILEAMDSPFGYFGYIDEAGSLACPALTRDREQGLVAGEIVVFPRADWAGLWGRSLTEMQTQMANEGLQLPSNHLQLESALAVPIVFLDTLIGQFVVANKLGGYSPGDQELLESAAAQTAPVLSALLEEVRQRREHERLEDQLRQAQKMESVGRLAGGVAHDFNNMLGVILGNTELALEKIDPEQSVHEDLREIMRAAERSADLTRQLLAFARKQTVSPKILDLNQTVSGMLKLLRRLIGEDIALDWVPGSEVWPVEIDPGQIDQILANLCVNARDAIKGPGRVTIETGNASFTEADCSAHADLVPGSFVMLAVSDDGCGMDLETQLHLFEPFFTTKKAGEGTGLGLATVYGIVKQNNGIIDVYSEPDRGTTFKIYLPRHTGEAVQAEEERAPAALGHGHETVLLVEDEPAVLNLSKVMLQRMGYSVLATGKPVEAIALAEKHTGPIDLLVTDVIMPEMNGRELAARLLKLYPDIKQLFMSGYTASVIAHHGVMAEGMHFLQKPFSMKNLSDKVREALA
jgi:PAS domain S-box-containing protein